MKSTYEWDRKCSQTDEDENDDDDVAWKTHSFECEQCEEQINWTRVSIHHEEKKTISTVVLSMFSSPKMRFK
jgi:hypothetical protein